jgi:hypothetical protein
MVDVVTAISRRLNWPVNDSSIRRLELNGLRSCRIYDAYFKRVLDGTSVGVAMSRDGKLIVSSEKNALNDVFATCVSPATPAGTLATLLVAFSRFADLRVLHDNRLGAAQDLLRKAHQDFAPPQIFLDRDLRVVRFLALSMNGSALYRVDGRIGRNVSVTAELLSGQAEGK